MPIADITETARLANNVTDVETPDPAVLPEIPSWYILLRPVPIATKTKGGIILSANIQEKYEYVNNVARVLKVGNLAYKHPKFSTGDFCKVGDFVVFGRTAADMRFDYKGVSLILLKDENVRMVVPAPEDLSQFSGMFENEYGE